MLLFYETEIPKIPLQSILDNGYSIHDFPTPGETSKRTCNIRNVKYKMQKRNKTPLLQLVKCTADIFSFGDRRKRPIRMMDELTGG